MFDMGNGESSTSRWSAINLPAQKSGTGLYGILSKATWSSNVPRILQTPLEPPDSRVVRSTSPSSSDTKFVAPDRPAEGADQVETSLPHVMMTEAKIVLKSKSSISSTPQIVPSTKSPMLEEISTASAGARDPDQDSVMGDDLNEDAPSHKTTPGELLHVMTDLAKDTSNEVRCTWLKDSITIRTYQTVTTSYQQQVQAYGEQIADLRLKIADAGTTAK